MYRQSLAYLCAVTRLALTLEFHTLGNLDGLSAILGCPLHMPHIDLIQSEAVLGRSPQQQSLVCTSLLLAINWLRELLNAWAHHVQPSEYAPVPMQLHLTQDDLLAGACRWVVVSHSLSMLVFASGPQILSACAYILNFWWLASDTLACHM